MKSNDYKEVNGRKVNNTLYKVKMPLRKIDYVLIALSVMALVISLLK